MSTKDEYLRELQTQLDTWQVEVDELEAKTSAATDENKAEIDGQITNLRTKLAEGETRFNELADATDETWEELKVDAEAMSDKLSDEEAQEDIPVTATESQGWCAKIKSFFS